MSRWVQFKVFSTEDIRKKSKVVVSINAAHVSSVVYDPSVKFTTILLSNGLSYAVHGEYKDVVSAIQEGP